MNRILILCLFIFSCSHSPVVAKYQRKEWKHWIDEDRDCLDTRAEILQLRSRIPVRMNKKGCTVVSGEWEDYYYPEIHLESRKVDIDHLVPLKNAYLTGGKYWNKNQRKTFANDVENLVITNRSYNRSKGAKGIDQWLPIHRGYVCKYIIDWIKIKQKYGLEITASEQQSISLSNCVAPPVK